MQTASKSLYIFPLLIVKKKKRRDIKVDYLHTLQRVANSSELFFSKKKNANGDVDGLENPYPSKKILN